jgi:nicotinamidase-related amidase
LIQVPARPRPFPIEGLDPAELAVVLVDMQRDFLDDDGYLASLGFSLDGVRAAVEPSRRLLAAARAAGITAIYTRQGYRPDLHEVPRHRRTRIASGDSRVGAEGPLGRFLLRGEPGFEIISELAPEPGDVVIDKSGCGAFWGTELAASLTGRRISALVFAGVTTDICVHSSLREANDRGFECLLAEDACGSGDPAMHAAAVEMVTIENGVLGVVADVDAIVAAFAAAGPDH